MRMVKVGELVLDFDLYPRASIDSYHAGEMQKALEAGATLPPIVIDKKSRRVADGFHRHRCYSRMYGDEHQVEVVEKEYKNDRELFLDAIRYNAAHGLRMDTHDKTHCILRAKALRVSDEDLATVMHIDQKRIGELQANRVATSGGGVQVALKRTIGHMHGRKLTKPQVAANKKLSGMNQQFYVNQVITLIENDLLDKSDDDLLERLKVLHGLLDGLLVS